MCLAALPRSPDPTHTLSHTTTTTTTTQTHHHHHHNPHDHTQQSITRDAGGQVTSIAAQLHLAGDFKKTKLKLTWLADVDGLVPLVLTEFDYLITKKKVRWGRRATPAIVLV
jgi:hypothetical protein